MKYFAIIILFLTASCVETLILGAAAGGIFATQSKSLGDAGGDVLISAKIDKSLIASGLKNPNNKIGVTVDKKRVLLTGIVDNAVIAKKAVEIAWKTKNVKEVIDEVQVVNNKSLGKNFVNYFKDSSITTQINSKALLNENAKTLDFDVVTVNQVVYLIGSAKRIKEIKAVIDIAATTIGVRKVINHIVLD
ncbi:MAG: osmotically-inducible protein OsmY [Lentimonas sp.]|jgi:osmotically-inducible protein OsmY